MTSDDLAARGVRRFCMYVGEFGRGATRVECERDDDGDWVPYEDVAALIREAEARGMERAAKLVDKRAEEYDREFGSYDYTTGVTEYPGTGDESMEEWETISAAIRAEAAAIKGETT